MKKIISEADVEENVLEILEKLGYGIIRGDNEDYMPGGSKALRQDYKDVVLVEKLREALIRINPRVPREAIEQAIKHTMRSEGQKLVVDNESFHTLLTDGVDVAIKGYEERYGKVWLF